MAGVHQIYIGWSDHLMYTKWCTYRFFFLVTQMVHVLIVWALFGMIHS